MVVVVVVVVVGGGCVSLIIVLKLFSLCRKPGQRSAKKPFRARAV